MALDMSRQATPIRAGRPRSADTDGHSVEAQVAPVRSRRSWRYTAGAVAAIIAGGLLSVALYTQSQHTVTLFTVASTVPRGATFTAGDLATITITPGQHVDGYTTAQSADILGKVATVTLPAGSLITRGSVAATLPVEAGDAVVGIAVKPSQMPATGLTPGDTVVVTPIAGQNGTVESKTAAPVDVTATVTDAPTTDQTTGLVIVDVSVPSAEASDLAGRAAAGQVTLYLTGGTGGQR